MSHMMTPLVCVLAIAMLPFCTALVLSPPAAVARGHARQTSLQMLTGREVVKSFVAATEKGDAAAASLLCTEDFLYKTHTATTESLAAAQDRLKTKVPVPSKVTSELHEENVGTFVREIVVRPVPFITVAVRQEFDVECPAVDECQLSRAEFIKQ